MAVMSSFGMRKGAVFNRYSRPKDVELRKQYSSYLRQYHGVGPALFIFRLIGDRFSALSLKYLARLMPDRRWFRHLRRKLQTRHQRLGEGESFFWKSINFKALLYLWSVELATEQLIVDMQQNGTNVSSMPDSAVPEN